MSYVIDGKRPKELRVQPASKARVFEHVNRTDDDDDIVEAGIEEGSPDREVGSLTPSGRRGEGHADHVESPVYPDALPWPPVVAKKPYKLKGA